MLIKEPIMKTAFDHEGSPQAKVVALLKERGVASAAEIARSTGLAKSTVSTLVSQLRTSGVIVESPRSEANAGNGRGRPATALMLNPAVGTCIGILLAPTFVELAVADVSHAILDRRGIELPADYDVATGVDAVRRLVEEAYAATGILREQLLGVGIAFPGPVDPSTGCVLRSSLVPTWAGIDVKEAFSEIFGAPIFADNESNCSAVAEMTWGVAKNETDFLYVKLDVGIGGAIVIDRRVIRGAAGGAGEIGHISIEKDGPLCRCGNRGCFELYASWDAIVAPARALLGANATFEAVANRAHSGDTACRNLLEDAAVMAGRGLAAAGSMLNPRLIVLGGRQMLGGALFLDKLRESYERHSHIKSAALPEFSRTRIVVGEFTNNTDAVLGAIGMVLRGRQD
jgi:predicted NBD/HSP70 family sugar kinase